MGRNGARWAVLVILLAAVVALAAVGQSIGSSVGAHSSPQQQSGPTPTAGAIPPCAKAGKPVAIPAEFGLFPLPPGTILDSRTDPPGSIVISGITPYDLGSISGFFERDMLPSGFKLLERESEPGQEVEASFKGNGHTGRWRAKPLLNCPGASFLTVSIAR